MFQITHKENGQEFLLLTKKENFIMTAAFIVSGALSGLIGKSAVLLLFAVFGFYLFPKIQPRIKQIQAGELKTDVFALWAGALLAPAIVGALAGALLFVAIKTVLQ